MALIAGAADPRKSGRPSAPPSVNRAGGTGWDSSSLLSGKGPPGALSHFEGGAVRWFRLIGAAASCTMIDGGS